MTDAAYRAKNWLMRTDELEEQRLKQIEKVMLLESKLNNCVSHYESNGGRDPVSSRAAHEDLLLDYSIERKKLEEITNKVMRDEIITIKVIDRINNYLYHAILFDAHINRRSISEMAKKGGYELKKSQLYEQYKKALEALAEILETKPPEIIPNEELTIISQAPA